jgi:hypothetical protein
MVVRARGNHAGEETISFDAGKLRTGLEVIANQLSKELAEDNPVSPVVRGEMAPFWCLLRCLLGRTNMPLLEINQSRHICAFCSSG